MEYEAQAVIDVTVSHQNKSVNKKPLTFSATKGKEEGNASLISFRAPTRLRRLPLVMRCGLFYYYG